MADLYIVLYDSVVSNSATGHGREGYYFAENGEYMFYDVAKVIAEALVAKGIGTSEPTSFTEEDYKRTPIVSGLQLAIFWYNTNHSGGAAQLPWHELSLPCGQVSFHRLEACQDYKRHVCEHQARTG